MSHTEPEMSPDGRGDGAMDSSRPTHPRTLARLVRGKNIDETTLLATDYLNHFNEVIMLLELIPDMPECLDDAKTWEPKSYADHFRDSVFKDKELAIFAYEHAPTRFRAPFDAAIDAMNQLVADGVVQIEAAIATGESGRVAETVSTVCRSLQRFVEVVSAIIHGDERTVDQTAIDAILNS